MRTDFQRWDSNSAHAPSNPDFWHFIKVQGERELEGKVKMGHQTVHPMKIFGWRDAWKICGLLD